MIARIVGRVVVTAGLVVAVSASSVSGQSITPHSGRGTPDIRTARADAAAVESVRAVDAHTQLPAPNLGRYPQDLGAAALDWITGLLDDVRPGLLTSVGDAARFAVYALAAIATAWVLFRLGRAALRRYATRKPDARSPPPTTADPEHPAPATSAPREELEARLAAGDIRGALEALWWWLAERLLGGAADPSWTSRELIREAGRGDLRPLVRNLDRMLYGAALPGRSDVRALLRQLEEELG